GKEYALTGFTYTPAPADEYAGTVFLYRVYASRDGRNWTLCETTGEFSNIKNNPIPQTVRFKTAYPARYFRFESVREMDNRPFITVGELDVLVK
ncbi:MAG: discoidin domain-containing protein, partial [Odoribacter sp.]|nr:discoidin domain-containing protein [Odoribacter sp.]